MLSPLFLNCHLWFYGAVQDVLLTLTFMLHFHIAKRTAAKSIL